MRRLTAATVISALLAVLTVPPAAARASVYSQVLHVYQTQGTIPACAFQSAELAAALRGVDTYGQQYFADFSNAIQGALAARAAGACTPVRHPASHLPLAAGPPLPSSATAPTSAGIPLALLLLGGLGLVLAAAAGLGALTRGLGWEPSWLAAWRHAGAEAGYRIGGGWADFADRWRAKR